MICQNTLPFLLSVLVFVCAPILPTKVMLCLVMLTGVILFANRSTRKGLSITRHPSDPGVLALACLYCLSALISMGKAGDWKVGALMAAFIGFYLLVVNTVHTQKQLQTITRCFVWSSVPVALYGIYQYIFPELFNFAGEWVDPQLFPDLKVRVYSTFANPNVFGCYLLLVIPFVLAFIIAEKKLWKKVTYVLAGCILTTALLLTWSRGCWLGALCAVFLFFVLLDKRSLILLAVAVVVALLFAPESVIQRFASIVNQKDSSISFRILIYTGVVAMLGDYWFTGIGPGAFQKVFPNYAPSDITTQHSHNLYLQLACDAGIWALLAFGWILFGLLRSIRKSAPMADREQKLFSYASLAALFGFLVQSLFDHTFYNYRVMLLFWGVTGLAALYTGVPRSKEYHHD